MINSIEHKEKTEKQIKKEVKKEFKFLASGKKRKGMHIYGINPDTMEVYKVEIAKSNTLNVVTGATGSHKAYLNPNHEYLWAINFANAKRKLTKKICKTNKQ